MSSQHFQVGHHCKLSNSCLPTSHNWLPVSFDVIEFFSIINNKKYTIKGSDDSVETQELEFLDSVLRRSFIPKKTLWKLNVSVPRSVTKNYPEVLCNTCESRSQSYATTDCLLVSSVRGSWPDAIITVIQLRLSCPSWTRGWNCSLQLLLGLASTAILGS
jgi:hypothetical protein